MRNTIESIILSKTTLGSKTSDGWQPTLCSICMDHGRKGMRAAFKFSGNGDMVYHCFNCGFSCSFDSSRPKLTFSKNVIKLLDSIGVDSDDIKKIKLEIMGIESKSDKSNRLQIDQNLEFEPDEILLPKEFYNINTADPTDKWANVAKYYLNDVRGIDYKQYNFMISSNQLKSNKWSGRVIIPIFKDGKLIYYQGRDMIGDPSRKKYENPNIQKSKVLFGFDIISKKTKDPIYIVEGIFDAMSIDGVAVFGNKMTKHQIHWLNSSTRMKVYVPDMYGDGGVGAKQAIDNGWSISIPDIGSCKDMNEAVLKYGKIYAVRSLATNIVSGFEATLKLKVLVR